MKDYFVHSYFLVEANLSKDDKVSRHVCITHPQVLYRIKVMLFDVFSVIYVMIIMMMIEMVVHLMIVTI